MMETQDSSGPSPPGACFWSCSPSSHAEGVEMNDKDLSSLLFWLGVLFIVICLLGSVAASCTALASSHGQHPTDCLDYPPVCDYGRVALCWCTEDAGCKWYCVADGSFG